MIEEDTATEGTPAPESMPDATPRPPLTQLRALLLAAIGSYLDRARLQEVREGVTELEIQKLAYFLQLVGAPLNLGFTRGRYGPYAERLSRVLGTLEGHYLTGLGDRSARVLQFAPINPTPGSQAAVREVMEQQPDSVAQLAALLDLVDGFETPYSLELLATVHYAAVQSSPTSDVDALVARVASWSLRKARMFTERHVRIAAARLTEHQLLPVS